MKALMYHYVREFNSEIPDLNFLHIDDFCKQLDYLNRKYGFVKKEDFLQSIRLKDKCPEGIILTFDDGLRDHFKHVLPALIERDLWGVFYVSSGVYKEERMLSVQITQFLIAKYGAKELLETIMRVKEDFKNLDEGLTKEHNEKVYLSQDSQTEEVIVKKILNYYLDSNTKDKLCSYLLKSFGEVEKELSREFYLTEEEIKSLHNSGMIIGSHGVNHHPMVNLTTKESEAEIIESLEFIDSLIDKKTVKTFCYPHGLPHTYKNREIEILNNSFVDFSFAVESRDIVFDDLVSNIHSLPRYDCNEFEHGSSYKHKA